MKPENREGEKPTDERSTDHEAMLLDVLAADVDVARMDVAEVVHDLVGDLRDGEKPTAEQVKALRVEMEGLEFVRERYLAALADGVTPKGQHAPEK